MNTRKLLSVGGLSVKADLKSSFIDDSSLLRHIRSRTNPRRLMKITSLPPLSTSFLTAILFALALSLPSACHAADGSCPMVFDALTKVVTTPHHTFSTQTAGGANNKSVSNESIETGGAIYVKLNGKWTRSRLTSQEMLTQTQENRKNARNAACHYVRDDVVRGESASVYTAHSETEDAKTDAQVWISKSNGLPLREEIDMDTGDGQAKSHYSMRYEYGNVKAPI